LKDDAVFHSDGGLSLNQPAEASGDLRLDLDGLSGLGGAEDFGADGGELEAGHRGVGRVALGDDASQLGGGFDQEHTWEQRLIGEMAAQKRFISPEQIFAASGAARVEGGEVVEKTEFGAVGQEAKGVAQRVVHFFKGSTI
jgi:hypothetical protein